MTGRLFGWEDPRPAAVMRIGLGLVLLWDAAFRWPYMIELYSSAGMPMPLYPDTIFAPPALPPMWCVVGYVLMLFALTAVVLGWQTRFSLVAAFVLCAWFGLLDMAGSFKKFSVIGLHLLALLPFTQSHAVWSIDVCTHKDRRQLSPRWPRFLMGVLVSMVYLGAVITKVRLADFGSGDLLMFSMLDERWGGTRLGMWLSTQPGILAILSIGTILYELAAALLLWVPQTRRVTLIAGILFHLSISATMHVGIFSPMMIVALCAFLEESDLIALRKLFGLQTSGTESPTTNAGPNSSFTISVFLYSGIAAACGLAGLYQQQQADYFGAFANRPAEWNDIDPKTIEAFSSPACPQVTDFFHRVEIGSRVESFRAFGHRTIFPRGETVYVLVRMQQYRPNLVLHWTLIAPDGKPLEQVDRPLENWPTHAWYAFRMTSPQNPTGDYTIILEASYPAAGPVGKGFERCVIEKNDRREIIRKTFRLVEVE